MKKNIILLMLFFTSFTYSQDEIMGVFKIKKYGVQLNEEIEVNNEFITLSDVKIIQLKNEYLKDFFNNPSIDNSSFWDIKNEKKVIFKSKSPTKYTITVPPLQPNTFYKVLIKYYGSDNILSIIRMIHNEGKDNWYTTKKNWMKKLDAINANNGDLLLTYQVTKNKLFAYKSIVTPYDLENLTPDKKTELIIKTKEHFENLNFQGAKPLDPVEFDNNIIAYAKRVKALTFASINQINVPNDTKIFEEYFECLDYVNIYNFYNTYLKSDLENKSFDSVKYLNSFSSSRETEENIYIKNGDLTPNYLNTFEVEIDGDSLKFSTFPLNFDQAFKNAIIPDFGFVIYDNFSNTLSGGSPFLGVNISLSPSNKDIPLQISSLTLLQRLSIHTGVILDNISVDKKRANLFKSNSLLLGVSYKLLNHAYRINIGSLIYKKNNPIDDSKSFAFSPYVGISIDLEIRKWLTTVFPSLTL